MEILHDWYEDGRVVQWYGVIIGQKVRKTGLISYKIRYFKNYEDANNETIEHTSVLSERLLCDLFLGDLIFK